VREADSMCGVEAIVKSNSFLSFLFSSSMKAQQTTTVLPADTQ